MSQVKEKVIKKKNDKEKDKEDSKDISSPFEGLVKKKG